MAAYPATTRRAEGTLPAPLRLYVDGFYGDKADAADCLAQCAELGATALGLIESPFGSWGILYAAPRVLFPAHVLDRANALRAIARLTAPTSESRTPTKGIAARRNPDGDSGEVFDVVPVATSEL